MFNKQTKLINSKYKKGNPYLCITQKIKLNPTTTVVKIIKHKNSNSYSSLNNLIKQDSKISYDKKIRSISPKMSHKSDTFTFERNKSKSNSIYINKKNISLKVKDDYLNKYSNLSNKINNLKKRSEELNNKIIAYKKKNIKIKKIQKTKSDLKIQILEAKKKNEEELNEKKNKIKSLRKIAKERNKSSPQLDEEQKENGQTINNEENQKEENEIDEIAEEEQEFNDENNKLNKDETQAQRNQNEEGQSKIERLFIYLRTGFSWRPIPTINSTFLCLEITGVIFLLIGVIIIIFTRKIKEIQIRYDDKTECEIGKECSIDFEIGEDMEKNVFIYYRLTNFYQNHRRYIKSKSSKQLKGNFLTEDEIKDDCDPIILNKDINETLYSYDGTTKLDPDKVAHPCGLIAKSVFNDTYEIKKKVGDEQIIIEFDDIAWSVDKDKYKNSANSKEQWYNVEDERFMVWMRPAAMPDFRKPWGKIKKDLSKGNYTLIINNKYPVKSFDGKKFFILSTVNGLGGKNYFLAILYLVVGGISVIAGILFRIGYKKYNSEKYQKIE